MVSLQNVADLAVWDGPHTFEITRIRRNKKTNVFEYRHKGMWSKWNPIHGKGIPIRLVSPEKPIVENGVETKFRMIRIRQSINGDIHEEIANSKMVSEFEHLKAENIRLQRLARQLEDSLKSMHTDDKMKQIMMKYFKLVKDVKQEGSTMGEYDMGRFSRPGIISPSNR